jgi:hypothetical protein
VGPGLEHLARICGPSVLTDMGVNTRDVTSEDDEASILLMVERRICFVIEAMTGAGLSVEHDSLEKPLSPLRAKGEPVEGTRYRRKGGGDDPKAAAGKGKGGKKKGRGQDANVRVPSRAMLELRLSGGRR